MILEETPRGECASDALGAFLFLEEEKMDGASGKETCGGAHESVSVALTDPYELPAPSPPVIHY